MDTRSYIEKLRCEAEKQNRLSELQYAAAAEIKLARAERLRRSPIPLEDQITALMESLPPIVRDRLWSMAELVEQLKGKYKDRPHAKNVGQALRSLGWIRVRIWSNGADGQRLWKMKVKQRAKYNLP